ncbi:hypothetical protein H5410_055917 [Solanum commersonii]|uniref:Uncharacterized protein n=1 Tax=Solanum commersonii TaxID=4109 RepID=A0A9J5WKK7_SOLCO|nr:hypothetical protein H5410_055917 [Solanum commersonii]
MKWDARLPKDNNLQQNLSQAKDVIHDFLRSSNVIDVDICITDGGKKLELEVGKVQFEVHLPTVKPITTSNSFKHLEEYDEDREVCYSKGMKKASTAANIASSSNTSSKLTKPNRDSASKLQTKSPYVIDNYCPILSGKPPKNVHNEAQGINLEVQLWSPNLLVDVPLQVITPTDENSTGNHDNNEENSEDEEDEYDPDYGVEQENNTEEKGEKVEDVVSQHRQYIINNGNLSPRSVSRNANVNHKDFAKPGPITRAMGKAFQIAIQEPFVDACHIDKYRKDLGFEGCSSNCNGKFWILWSNDFHIDVAEDNEQQLTLIVTNKSNTEIVWFTAVYAKSKQHLGLPLWDSLRNCNNFIDEPWCIYGDFNAIMSPDEKKGGKPHKMEKSWDFISCMND